MLGFSTRNMHVRLAKNHMRLSRLPVYSQAQWREMGLIANIKKQLKNEMEKNGKLQRSFEELENTKKRLKSAEQAAKEKFVSVTDDISKSFHDKASQASRLLTVPYEEAAKIATAAKKDAKAEFNEKEADFDKFIGIEQGQPKMEGDKKHKQTSDILDEARAFVKGFIAGLSTQRNKVIHPNKWLALRDEWKDAAQELFGKRKKQTVDEALVSARTPSLQTPIKTKSNGDKSTNFSGTNALVAVKVDESAWQRVSARFREAPIIKGILDAAKQAAKTETGKKLQQKTKQVKDKVSDAQEEVLEVWETSQNPWVYRLSSIYDGIFGETPMGVAIREIRRAEPNFILEEWKKNIEEIVLPGVLEAFLRGNSRDLKKWFGEAAYSRVNIAIRERKSEGLVMDPHVLSIDNVDVIEATVENKQAPIILVRFQAQQINCIRNREGEVAEGSEDEVLAYYYIFAFQRDYDEEQETLRWKIVDLHMQRGGRYY